MGGVLDLMFERPALSIEVMAERVEARELYALSPVYTSVNMSVSVLSCV